MTMEKKLYKSRTNKKVCGVCGGLADYLEMDATILRLIAAALVIFCGAGLIAYIVAALIIPFNPEA
jgi:phage shock protein C